MNQLLHICTRSTVSVSIHPMTYLSLVVWINQSRYGISIVFKLLKVIDKSRHAGHATSVNKVLWTDHQDQIVSCSDDRKISVWELKFN
jgi:WD40 repeat protein